MYQTEGNSAYTIDLPSMHFNSIWAWKMANFKTCSVKKIVWIYFRKGGVS